MYVKSCAWFVFGARDRKDLLDCLSCCLYAVHQGQIGRGSTLVGVGLSSTAVSIGVRPTSLALPDGELL